MDFLDSAPLEKALVRQIAQGDIEAFGELYDRYSTALHSLAFRILNNLGDAEEVTQEVFLNIWQRAGSFDESKGKPLSWAVQITRNQAIDRLRARERKPHTAGFRSEFVSETAAAMEQAVRMPADEADGIGSAVKGLPDNQRRAIELAFFDGLSHPEIADVLQEPPGTIKARIRRGMVSLRDALEFKASPARKDPTELGKHPIALTA